MEVTLRQHIAMLIQLIDLPRARIEESLKPLISSLPSSAPGMFALQKNAEGECMLRAVVARRGALKEAEGCLLRCQGLRSGMQTCGAAFCLQASSNGPQIRSSVRSSTRRSRTSTCPDSAGNTRS